jgi:hypothetical protein
MAQQQINWTQIDTTFVPTGTTVDLGSGETPLNAVYTNDLIVSGQSIGDLIANGIGASGSSGSSGTSGTSGTSGSNGSSGTSGSNGSSGTSGTSGS